MNQRVESKPTLRVDAAHSDATHAPVVGRASLRVRLQRWWQNLWTEDLSSYLSHAESTVDLQYRIRRWNEHECRGRMPLL